MKFLNKVLSFLQWMWKRPEVQEAYTALQATAWADLKDIAFQAIAEVKAGNFTDGTEKQKQAFNRIWAYTMNKGKPYPKWIINWVIEHAYARFATVH